MTVPTLVTHEPAFAFGSFELCQEVATGIRGAQFVIVNDNSIAGRVHDENIAAIDRFLRSGNAPESSRARPLTRPRLAGWRTRSHAARNAGAAAGCGWSDEQGNRGELGVAVSTIERHLVNLYTKIGARGRADAIAYALRHGLDTPPV